MPEHEPNLLVGAPFYAEGIMRALGIKGNLPRELYPLFGVQFTLADLSGEEFAWTRRSYLFHMGLQQAIVGAELPRAVLTTRIAAASHRTVLCVLDEVIVSTTTAGTVGIQWGVNFLGSGIADPVAGANTRDDRGVGRESSFSMAIGTNAVNPLAGNNFPLTLLPANTSHRLQGPWILSNRDTGVFRSAFMVLATGAVEFRVAMKWREREMLPEES